jgi:hypothetical protein
MRSMLENIFRILTSKLANFSLGAVQKDESMNESMNQSINESTDQPGDGFGKNES